MATAAAAPLSTDETRRAPAGVTSFGSLVVLGGVVLMGIAGGIAGASSTDENFVLDRFWRAYLLGTMYASSFSLGGLFFVIAHHLTGGRWGTSLRRLAEIVASTTPYIVLLFIPILANVLSGADTLYVWNNTGYMEASEVLRGKMIYLNSTWFAIRTVSYLAIFCGLSWFFVGRSLKQDETGKVAGLRTLSRWSGPSMVLFAVALNFAAFDWMMSLMPTWFSTIYGVYFFAGCFLSFLALLMLLSIGLQSLGVLTDSITKDNRHDVAKLMFAFVVFWGYIAFSQFLLIWYANVPEETEWFSVRQIGETTAFGIGFPLGVLFVVHLFIPFVGFMSSAVRRSKPAMVFWSCYLLLVHALDLAFLILPGTPHTSAYVATPVFSLIGPMEIVCLLGGFAVILGATMRAAEDKWLLPVRDPRLTQSVTYHNH